jgi:hypothetical protein
MPIDLIHTYWVCCRDKSNDVNFVLLLAVVKEIESGINWNQLKSSLSSVSDSSYNIDQTSFITSRREEKHQIFSSRVFLPPPRHTKKNNIDIEKSGKISVEFPPHFRSTLLTREKREFAIDWMRKNVLGSNLRNGNFYLWRHQCRGGVWMLSVGGKLKIRNLIKFSHN